MKRWFSLLVLGLSLSATLVACGGSGGSGTNSSEAEGEGDVVAPGEVAVEQETITAEDVEITPDIVVADQTPEDTTVVIDSISTPEDGWIVVYSDAGGEPGEVLGQEQVFLGLNPRVMLDLSSAPATGSTLIAVLHQDGGTLGEFEPETDLPVQSGEAMVQARFTLEGGE